MNISGRIGDFVHARGESHQTLLGFNGEIVQRRELVIVGNQRDEVVCILKRGERLDLVAGNAQNFQVFALRQARRERRQRVVFRLENLQVFQLADGIWQLGQPVAANNKSQQSRKSTNVGRELDERRTQSKFQVVHAIDVEERRINLRIALGTFNGELLRATLHRLHRLGPSRFRRFTRRHIRLLGVIIPRLILTTLSPLVSSSLQRLEFLFLSLASLRRRLALKRRVLLLFLLLLLLARFPTSINLTRQRIVSILPRVIRRRASFRTLHLKIRPRVQQLVARLHVSSLRRHHQRRPFIPAPIHEIDRLLNPASSAVIQQHLQRLVFVPHGGDHDCGVPIVVTRAWVLSTGAESPANGVELGVSTRR